MENSGIFRKKSIDRLSNPEQLNEYLHVTNPSIWMILGAVVLILLSLFVWSYFTSVKSYAYGTGTQNNGVLTISFDNQQTGRKVQVGMEVSIGELESTVSSVATDSNGNIIAVCKMDIPDGSYDKVKVCYKEVQILSLLFD